MIKYKSQHHNFVTPCYPLTFWNFYLSIILSFYFLLQATENSTSNSEKSRFVAREKLLSTQSEPAGGRSSRGGSHGGHGQGSTVAAEIADAEGAVAAVGQGEGSDDLRFHEERRRCSDDVGRCGRWGKIHIGTKIWLILALLLTLTQTLVYPITAPSKHKNTRVSTNSLNPSEKQFIWLRSTGNAETLIFHWLCLVVGYDQHFCDTAYILLLMKHV